MPRALWQWAVVAGVEARKGLLEECRRMRSERDGATDRERQLKKGLASLRDERSTLERDLLQAQSDLQKATGAPNEEQVLRRQLTAAQGERDGLARALREAREQLNSRDGEREAMAERDQKEKSQSARAFKEKQQLLKELSDVKAERKEMAAREVAALERARTQRQQMEKMRGERDAAVQKAENATQEAASAARASGDLVPIDESKKKARQLAAAARIDLFVRGPVVLQLIGDALRRWALVSLGRPAGIDKEEAHSLMGHYRESRRLVKQLAAAREELKEQSTNHSSLATRLKSERRQSETARQERDASKTALVSAREEAAESKRKEEAAKAALGAAKRELAELRKAFAAAKAEADYGEVERGAAPPTGATTMQRANKAPPPSAAQQRRSNLEEADALAKELESLQVALQSPQREPRASRGSAAGVAPQPGPLRPQQYSPVRPSPLAAAAFASSNVNDRSPYPPPTSAPMQPSALPTPGTHVAQHYAVRGAAAAVSPTPKPGSSAVARGW